LHEVEETMPGKGGSSTVHVHNGPVNVDADSTVEVKGLNDIKLTLQPNPLHTKTEVLWPETLKTDGQLNTQSNVKSESSNAMTVDLKPVAVDLCLNASTKLPEGQIHQPFSFHFGFTWFGLEVFGVNIGGESKTLLKDLPKRPAIDWPAQQNAPAHPPAAHPVVAAHDTGLRVRVR
jgi:hypothetical protein